MRNKVGRLPSHKKAGTSVLRWLLGGLSRAAATGLVVGVFLLIFGATPAQEFAQVWHDPPAWIASDVTRWIAIFLGLATIATVYFFRQAAGGITPPPMRQYAEAKIEELRSAAIDLEPVAWGQLRSTAEQQARLNRFQAIARYFEGEADIHALTEKVWAGAQRLGIMAQHEPPFGTNAPDPQTQRELLQETMSAIRELANKAAAHVIFTSNQGEGAHERSAPVAAQKRDKADWPLGHALRYMVMQSQWAREHGVNETLAVELLNADARSGALSVWGCPCSNFDEIAAKPADEFREEDLRWGKEGPSPITLADWSELELYQATISTTYVDAIPHRPQRAGPRYGTKGRKCFGYLRVNKWQFKSLYPPQYPEDA